MFQFRGFGYESIHDFVVCFSGCRRREEGSGEFLSFSKTAERDFCGPSGFSGLIDQLDGQLISLIDGTDTDFASRLFEFLGRLVDRRFKWLRGYSACLTVCLTVCLTCLSVEQSNTKKMSTIKYWSTGDLSHRILRKKLS